MKHLWVPLLEKTLGRRALSPRDVDPTRVKRVLVVRQHDQLGDFLLATPVLPALKTAFPDCHLGVVARGYFAQTLQGHPDVDEVLTWKPSRGWSPSSFLKFFESLFSGWDLAVVLNTVSHSTTSDLLARLSGAKWVVGSSHRVFPGAKRNFLYDIESPTSESPRHQTDRNLDIVKPLGAVTTEKSPRMSLTDEEKRQAVVFLESLGWNSSKPSVGLHLGAGKRENRWPLARFAELSRMLDSRGIQTVVTWGLGEDGLASELKALSPGPALYAGAPPLRLLGSLYQALTAVVVNDTGMLHLAAACGTPLVAVFGPTNPEDWCPLGPHFLSTRGVDQTVASVTAEQVWEKLLTLPGLK